MAAVVVRMATATLAEIGRENGWSPPRRHPGAELGEATPLLVADLGPSRGEALHEAALRGRRLGGGESIEERANRDHDRSPTGTAEGDRTPRASQGP